MSGIIKGLFLGLKNQKVIPFHQMTPELHNEISSGLAKIMMAAKMTKAKLTKAQRDYIMNQAKQVQEFEDRYITGIKDRGPDFFSRGQHRREGHSQNLLMSANPFCFLKSCKN